MIRAQAKWGIRHRLCDNCILIRNDVSAIIYSITSSRRSLEPCWTHLTRRVSAATPLFSSLAVRYIRLPWDRNRWFVTVFSEASWLAFRRYSYTLYPLCSRFLDVLLTC